MANLRIYSDIVGEEEKAWLQWSGADALAFSDVEGFIASMPADDEQINLTINCRGGSTRDALAMYDALRASGKTISAEVTGTCASSATILLLAARKDLRRARPNCTLLIHNPYVCGYVEGDADEMQKISNELKAERARFLDIYTERTGADRDKLAALMDEDRTMSVDEAIALGFIAEKITPISAKNKSDKMSKKSIWQTLGRALGVYGMCLETADGGTLELKKDDGAPVVGDEVNSPDGEYLMPDGATVVVEAGVIKEINPATVEEVTEEEPAAEEPEQEPETEATEEAPETKADEVEEDEKNAKIAELEAALAERDQRIAELTQQLEEATSNAKSDDEREILDAVKTAGGREWLAKASSNYSVEAPEHQAKAKPARESFAEFYKRNYK